MNTYVASSYLEIYETVSKIRRDYFGDQEMWFRGQGLNTYLLKPSLLRTEKGVGREKELFLEYKRLAAGINLNRNSEWETLIDMQHYGVPTRLLDWTSNLGVALYFAETSSVGECPMSLYLMNPTELNRLSGKNGIPTLPDESMGLSYMKNYVEREPFPARYPIAVRCDYVNSRVKAQSGMFTIHGDESSDVEIDIITALLDKKSAIYKIDISAEAHGSIREYFELNGIKVYTIFPDIQGIARYLSGLCQAGPA